MKRDVLTSQTLANPKRLLAAIIADRACGYSLVDREAEHIDRISTEEMQKCFLPLLRECAADVT
jgi:IclR family transcriptional regulator, pca regulon regulatory protein